MENDTSSNTTRTIMNKVFTTMGKAQRTFALITALTVLPLIATFSGCAVGSRTEQSTGERMDDRNTSSRVKEALSADTQFKFDGVNVETFKGSVQLSGFVTSREQKDQAGEIAKKVPAVKEVINNITVKTGN